MVKIALVSTPLLPDYSKSLKNRDKGVRLLATNAYWFLSIRIPFSIPVVRRCGLTCSDIALTAFAGNRSRIELIPVFVLF